MVESNQLGANWLHKYVWLHKGVNFIYDWFLFQDAHERTIYECSK